MKFKLYQKQAAVFLSKRNDYLQERRDDPDVRFADPTVHYMLGLVRCKVKTYVGVWLNHTDGTFLNMRIGDTGYTVPLKCLDYIEVDTDGVSITEVDIHLDFDGTYKELPF